MFAPKIKATAHAGCMNTQDDSIESVFAGIAAGADIVEVDIRFLQKNVPVLSHDAINPEHEECLVRLEEVLDVLKGYPDITINLDLKEIEGIRFLHQLIQKTDMEERVFLTGLEPDSLASVQQEGICIPYFMNYTPEFSQMEDPDHVNELLDRVKKHKAIGINLYYEFATRQLVEIFHEADMKVYVWTVDDQAEMRRMIRLGVDSITSRRVDLLVKTIKEAELHARSTSVR